jgi:hypothetical protein
VTEPAQFFRDMAARIEKNAAAEFAGAVVIIPPPGGGEPITFMILDPSQDLVQFFMSIKSRAETSAGLVMEKERQRQSSVWPVR